MTLGDAAEISPEAARKAAAVVKRAIALGRDPVAERRAAQREQIRASHDATAKAKAEFGDARAHPGAGQAHHARQAGHLRFRGVGPRQSRAMRRGLSSAMAPAAGVSMGSRPPRISVCALAEMGAAELKPAELDKQRVRALAELHAKAGRPATARHRRGVVSRLFKWLQAVEAIEDNPAARVGAPPPPAPRSHVPSAEAVKALWEAAERLPAAKGVY